jgi:hypothetical protein
MREFTLVDGVGMRLIQLYQRKKGESIIILLDSATIGSIDSYDEFTHGKQIVLLDGSILKVQLVNRDVQVFHNDLRLPAVPKAPSLPGFAFPSMDGYAIQQGVPPVPPPYGQSGYGQPGYAYPIYNGAMMVPPMAETGKGLAIAGFVLGIVSLVADLTFVLWFIGIVAAIVGIVLSALGRRSFSYKHMATWGLVLSIIALALPLLIFMLFFLFAMVRASSY